MAGVVATDDHRPPVDFPVARDEVRGSVALDLALLVVLDLAGQRADLSERAGIQQLIDAIAHWSSPRGNVAGDTFGTAHLLGQFAPTADLFEFRFPGHADWRL